MTKSDVSSPGMSARESHVVIGACCVALATLAPVALYQSGLLPRLPDPPLDIFNSEKITQSNAAHPLGVPDGWLGLASFGATLGLAIMAKRHRKAQQLLGAKLLLDGSAAAFNATRQVVSFKKLCSWCTGTALAAGAMVYGGRHAIQETWATARECAKRA